MIIWLTGRIYMKLTLPWLMSLCQSKMLNFHQIKSVHHNICESLFQNNEFIMKMTKMHVMELILLHQPTESHTPEILSHLDHDLAGSYSYRRIFPSLSSVLLFTVLFLQDQVSFKILKFRGKIACTYCLQISRQ